MNALIFAAGLGTRLKPLTDTMPKAMVPISGRPLVRILLEKLRADGCERAVVNVHHFADQIIDFVAQHDGFGMDVRISDERDMLLETGGGMKKALPMFADDGSLSVKPILVHNVDILSNVDLSSYYADAVRRIEAGAKAVMLVSERTTSRYLLFDDAMRLVGWTNISTGEVKSPYKDLDVECCHRLAFSGIQVVDHSILNLMSDWNGKFSIIDFYLSVCDKVTIQGFTIDGMQLLDVGKLDTVVKAEEFIANAE